MNERQAAAARRFRELHKDGCFVMPNPWDIGSTILLESLGFPALATTSAGFAFTRGLPDEVRSVPRDLMLAHIREIAGATALPVHADFQAGYADDPEEVAANVTRCVDTGAAALSIEDASGRAEAPLHDARLAVERVQAARTAIDASGTGVLLTARCEAFLVGHPDPLRTALERLTAFATAGADCLFAPGIEAPEDIAALVREVSPKPVNVIVTKPVPALSVARLAGLGVRRVSVGSALARSGWGAFIRAAREIADQGSFGGFAGAAPFAELNQLFGERKAGTSGR